MGSAFQFGELPPEFLILPLQPLFCACAAGGKAAGKTGLAGFALLHRMPPIRFQFDSVSQSPI